MSWYGGVDLGATNLRAAVADEAGAVRGRDRRRTPRGPDGNAVTDAVLAAVSAACEDAGVSPAELAAVGVGSIGPLDAAAGAVVEPPNLPDGVNRVPLVAPLADLAATEDVVLLNDAVAGVIGERFHADGPLDDVAYVTISSGLGVGAAVDGTVLRGWNGNAAELGHVVVDPAGRRTCGCGGAGHWEAYSGGDQIPGYARQLADEAGGVDTALPLDAPEFSAADVFEHAGDDAFAARVVDRVGHWNAVGFTAVLRAYAPRVIAVGGSVALHNPDRVLDPVRERLAAEAFDEPPELRLTALGEDVVLRGAIAAALPDGARERSRGA